MTDLSAIEIKKIMKNLNSHTTTQLREFVRRMANELIVARAKLARMKEEK